MAKIPEKGKALLEAQAVLFILHRFHGSSKDRAIVIQRAREEMKRYEHWTPLLDLEEIKLEDVNLYRDEALEVLDRSGKVHREEAHELVGEYRADIAERLGVILSKDGARLDQSNRKGVANAM